MSAGNWIGLFAVLVFFLLVLFLAYPLIKLGKVFDQTRISVRELSDGTLPLLTEVTATVSETNHQLVKVDTITTNAAQVSTNVSALTALFAATLGSPVVKVAAFSYGVRTAISGRGRDSRRRGR
jgi:2C-methyl-D-erythritol 2,4-cyclodiphosphate synthase